MRILFRHSLQRPLLLALALVLAVCTRAAGDDEPRGLDFYFIDVEGGAATLIVTPAGESILIDSGNPGDRDAGRIAAAAKDAGVSAIDYYITTHWHSDHMGGAAALAKLLPIRQRYGHAIPDPLTEDINKDLMAAWNGLEGTPVFLEPGQTIKFKGRRGAADLKLKVVAANGLVDGEKPGAPQITQCKDKIEARPEDTTDNARSLAMVLSFGRFELFAGGDLTWNVEHKLTCPEVKVPKVDVYIVDHHGVDLSNNPALVKALEPEVAIVNSGPRKGAEPETMKLLLKQSGDTGVFQIHRNVREGAVNTEPARIANEDENCKGSYIHLKVDERGAHFTVEVPSRQTVREYDVH